MIIALETAPYHSPQATPEASLTTVFNVSDMLVPRIAIGHGKDVQVVDGLLLGRDDAAPWSTIRLNSAPVICSFICLVPPSQGHGIHAHVHVLDGDAGVPGDDIAHFIHDGAADRGEIDAVFHDDVELDGDGVVVVISDADALAHGLPAQQMHQAVRHGAVGHALDAEAVGGRHAGDVGEDGAADGDIAVVRLELNHENVLSFPGVGTKGGGPPALDSGCPQPVL